MIRKLVLYPVLLSLTLAPALSSHTDSLTTETNFDSNTQAVQEHFDNEAEIVEYIEDPLIDLDRGNSYSSQDYSTLARELEKRYPDLLSFSTIGYSHDGKELFSIMMTKDVKASIERVDFKVFRMHYYIEAGVHGRETANPAILLKQIEDYAMDYYEDTHISAFSLESILRNSVLHFVPLVNPDGHDLAKFGPDSVNNASARELLSSVNDTDYSQWKANIAGVDLNKNFPDFYYEEETGELVDKWQKYPGIYYSKLPSGQYYPGDHPGSEPETQAVMEYMNRFDFRNYLSYHSRGNIVYYEYLWYPDEYREKAGQIGQITSRVTGYKPISDTGKGSGYSTSYHVAISLKPSLTVETLPYSTRLPSSPHTYKEAYDRTWLLPLYYAEAGLETDYYPYRLYVGGKYVRDFPNKEYALAVAENLGGEIFESTGVPEVIAPNE